MSLKKTQLKGNTCECGRYTAFCDVMFDPRWDKVVYKCKCGRINEVSLQKK